MCSSTGAGRAAVNLNEETEDSATAPGLAAVVSTVVLLVTYVVDDRRGRRIRRARPARRIRGRRRASSARSPPTCSARAGQARRAGDHHLGARLDADDDPAGLAHRRCRWRARARSRQALGSVHPRFLTPHVSTIVIGVVAAIWFAVLFTLSRELPLRLAHVARAMIAFYYALTGFACAIYYRRELTKSVKNFFFIGVGPVVGGADPRLPVLQGHRRVPRPGGLLLGQRDLRPGGAGGARPRAAPARGRPVDPLEAERARASTSGESARSSIPTWRPGARWALPRCRRRRSMGAIVLGYDASPGAKGALDCAIDLARRARRRARDRATGWPRPAGWARSGAQPRGARGAGAGPHQGRWRRRRRRA